MISFKSAIKKPRLVCVVSLQMGNSYLYLNTVCQILFPFLYFNLLFLTTWIVLIKGIPFFTIKVNVKTPYRIVLTSVSISLWNLGEVIFNIFNRHIICYLSI